MVQDHEVLMVQDHMVLDHKSLDHKSRQDLQKAHWIYVKQN